MLRGVPTPWVGPAAAGHPQEVEARTRALGTRKHPAGAAPVMPPPPDPMPAVLPSL